METRTRGMLFWTGAMLLCSAAAGAELVERLPKETALYATIDLGRTLTEGEKWVKFVDAESGETITVQTKELHKNVSEVLASQYGMKARLFDSLDSLKLHFVLVAKKEPEAKTHSYKTPVFDPETMEQIPDKFEEHEFTTTKTYDFAVIGETSPETAEDFMKQFKAFMAHQKEKNPDSQDYDYKNAEVERGELLTNSESFGALGRIDGLIVFSEDIPKDMWNMLCSSAAARLADDEVYKRLKAASDRPLGFVLVNVEQIVRTYEKSLTYALEEAKKKAAAASENPGSGQPGQDQWKLLRAQSNLGSFQLWKNALGLDRIGTAGVNTFMTVGEAGAGSGMNLMVQIREPLPPVLKLALDSGHKLETPAVVKPEAMCYMIRLGLDKMLFEIMTAIGEDKAQAVTQQLLKIKTDIGLDIPTLLAHLAGDVYVFMDMVKREITTKAFENVDGSEEPQMVTKKVEMTLPEFLVLFGLKDRKAFAEFLSATFTAVSASKNGAQFVKKRTYQETDVYLVGQGVSEEGADPDGMTSFATVVVDRHLSFGSWKDVTALIRKAKAAEGEEGRKLAGVLAQHEGAHIIAAVPKVFLKKLQKMGPAQAEDAPAGMPTDPFEMLAKMLENVPLPIQDEALGKKVKEGLQAWLRAFKILSEKAQDMGPEMALAHSRLTGGFYEMKSSQEIKKPAD